jgi:hypothetical protein
MVAQCLELHQNHLEPYQLTCRCNNLIDIAKMPAIEDGNRLID